MVFVSIWLESRKNRKFSGVHIFPLWAHWNIFLPNKRETGERERTWTQLYLHVTFLTSSLLFFLIFFIFGFVCWSILLFFNSFLINLPFSLCWSFLCFRFLFNWAWYMLPFLFFFWLGVFPFIIFFPFFSCLTGFCFCTSCYFFFNFFILYWVWFFFFLFFFWLVVCRILFYF